MPKLEKLQEEFLDSDEDSKAIIANHVKRARELIVRENLANSEALKQAFEYYKSRIKAMNQLLLSSGELKTEERNLIIAKREIYKEFIQFFDIKNQLQEIENFVDDELDNY